MSDEMKRLPSVVPGSLSKQSDSKLKSQLDERIIPSEALAIATKIVASYPGRRGLDDSYLGALASVLCSFPASVARRAHLCPGGIVTECSTHPSPAQLYKWLEENSAPLKRHYERETRVAAQLDERAEREAKKQTPRGMAMTQAWLDRTDPDAAALSGQLAKTASDLRLRAAARAKLIAEIGQEAFDAIPDAR